MAMRSDARLGLTVREVVQNFPEASWALMALVLAISVWVFHSQNKLHRLTRETHEAEAVNLVEARLSQNLQPIVDDLFIIADSPQMKSLWGHDYPQAKQAMGVLLLRWSRHKKDYYEMRVLDDRGMELVRVNYNHGHPYIVPEAELQDKSRRYFYTDSIKLGKEEVFISPLDLNVDKGQIEQPPHPTIRFCTPVFDGYNRKRGVLLFNYEGQRVLEEVRKALAASQGQVQLLNAQGYWLKGMKPEDEWGFLLEGREKKAFGNAFPSAWIRISTDESGLFYTRDGFFAFRTLHPLLAVNRSLTDRTRDPSLDRRLQSYSWKVVSYVPATALRKESRLLALRIAALNAAVLFLLLPGSWLLAMTRMRRRRMDLQLRQQAKLLNLADEAVIVLNPNDAITFWNRGAEKKYGWRKREALGRDCRELLHTRFSKPIREIEKELLRDGCWAGELIHITRDGAEVVDSSRWALQRDRQGDPVAILEINHDITERKRAQDELYQSRMMLQSILDSIPQRVFWKDRNCVYMGCNRALAADAGLQDPAEIVAKTDFDLSWKERAEFYRADDKLVMEQGSPKLNFDEPLSRPDDGALWVRSNKVPLRDREGKVIGVIGTYEDITERKQAEEALRKSEESFRLLFSAIPHPIFVYDAQSLNFVEVNESALATYGYTREEMLQIAVPDILAPEEILRYCEQRQSAAAFGPSCGTWKHKTKDGRVLTIEIGRHQFNLAGRNTILALIQDVTRRDQMEIELRQHQKLEAVGSLAAGIAHEINTPIQFIGDNTRFLLEAFASLQVSLAAYQEMQQAATLGTISPAVLEKVRRTTGEADIDYLTQEIPRALSQSLDGVGRVATIVRAMKEFAHPDRGEAVAADLNKALQSTLIVARNELKYVAEVEVDLGEIPLVICSPGDLNQAFLNLLVNAADAIREVVGETGQKGKIRVESRLDGDYIQIKISDTGCGIPEAIRAKVFEPFFTTKEVGRGTGQGLAIAHSIIVEKHKGKLSFTSEVDVGTTFVIRLPVHAELKAGSAAQNS